MKSTGIVRKLDELGRIVIPVEIRRVLNMNLKDQIEIYTDGNMIVLGKYQKQCVFCGDTVTTKEINNKSICIDCLKNIKQFDLED